MIFSPESVPVALIFPTQRGATQTKFIVKQVMSKNLAFDCCSGNGSSMTSMPTICHGLGCSPIERCKIILLPCCVEVQCGHWSFEASLINHFGNFLSRSKRAKLWFDGCPAALCKRCKIARPFSLSVVEISASSSKVSWKSGCSEGCCSIPSSPESWISWWVLLRSIGKNCSKVPRSCRASRGSISCTECIKFIEFKICGWSNSWCSPFHTCTMRRANLIG